MVIAFRVQKIMSTSRRGRHAERSPENEAAPPRVVENVDGTDDVVPHVSDDEDWEPLSNIHEQGSPPTDATAAPTTTTGNTLFVCVLKPVMK